ncbi:MAG: PKD domain-containing protein [bacterium]
MKKGKVKFNYFSLAVVLLLIICIPVIAGGEDITGDLLSEQISNIEMSEIPVNILLSEDQNENNKNIDLFEMGPLYAQIFEPYRYLFIADYEVGEDEIRVTDLMLNPENFLLVQDPNDPNDPVVRYWTDLGADPNLFGQNDPAMTEVFGRDFIVDLSLPIFADPNLRVGGSAIERIIQAGTLSWDSTVGGYGGGGIQAFLLTPLPVYPYDGMPTYLPARYAAIEAISALGKPYFQPGLVFLLEGALWNANVILWPNIAALDYVPQYFEDVIVTIEVSDGISSDVIIFPLSTINYPLENYPPVLQLDIEDQICYVGEICESHVNFIDPDCFIFSLSPVPTTSHVPGFPISSDFRTDMDELFWSMTLTNVPPDQQGPWMENIINPYNGLISFKPPYEGVYDAIISCKDGQGATTSAELTFFCITGMDTDGDGIYDSMDNCPQVPNPDQADMDSDGIGDECDNCPATYNPDQTDTDGNGIGDACEINHPPIADADGPYRGSEGSPVILSASGSNDPDGNPLQYRWDFNNDGIWDTDWSQYPNIMCTWLDDYSGLAKLEVTDGKYSDMDTAIVEIQNVAPDVGPDQTMTVNEREPVIFSGSFSDPGGRDTHTIEWDFGDGNSVSGTLTPTHTYMNSGIYTATFTVTDDDGGVGSKIIIVTVNDVQFPPEEQIAHILDFLDNSVEEGTLQGTGKNPVQADIQLMLLRSKLDMAGNLIMEGRFKAACQQLQQILKLIDGLPGPPDSATGDAVSELAEMIDELIATLNCK